MDHAWEGMRGKVDDCTLSIALSTTHAAFCLLSTSRSGKYTWKSLSLARFLAFRDVVELEMSSDAILRLAERLGHHMRRRRSRSIYVMDNPSIGSMTVQGVEAVERGPAST